MSGPTTLAIDKLARLIGVPAAPNLIDVRDDDDYAELPFHVPGSIWKSNADLEPWISKYKGQSVVVICKRGAKISQGIAAMLRCHGADAVSLDEGIVGWKAAGQPLVPVAKIPKLNSSGQSVWVTRSRPKVDRIACPWLIRRFVDPNAQFLFVPSSEVLAVADRFGATPFDIEGTYWSHRGELCTFDVMLVEFGLETEPLKRLSVLVRGADTARLDLAPEAAGLLAASLGLSRMYSDDLEQLEAGIALYDAFYRWSRDATEETHNWPTSKVKA